MCIWEIAPEKRHCEFCSYRGGCEVRPSEDGSREKARRYAEILSVVLGKDIMRRSRKSDVVWARYMLMYQMRMDGYSLSVVGKCAGVDHSTVVHAVKNVTKMLHTPAMYQPETEVWQKFLSLQKT